MIKKILATCFFVIAQISFANAGIPWEHWEHQNGWMEIYVDGKLVQNFVGDTLYNTKPTHCKRPLKKTNYVFRIGVYRGTYKNKLPDNYDKTYDEIHFDDFVSGKTKVFVKNFLNN